MPNIAERRFAFEIAELRGGFHSRASSRICNHLIHRVSIECFEATHPALHFAANRGTLDPHPRSFSWFHLLIRRAGRRFSRVFGPPLRVAKTAAQQHFWFGNSGRRVRKARRPSMGNSFSYRWVGLQYTNLASD